MPVLYSVTLTNPTNSLTLQLISISGTLPEFHSSFFIDKVRRERERERGEGGRECMYNVCIVDMVCVCLLMVHSFINCQGILVN